MGYRLSPPPPPHQPDASITTIVCLSEPVCIDGNNSFKNEIITLAGQTPFRGFQVI